MNLNRFKYFLTKKLFPDAIPVFHPPTFAAASATINATPRDASQHPVILLLGWGGSSRKNLRKLIQFYNDTGHGVISHTMPMSAPGFTRDYIEDLITDEVNKQLHQSSNDLVCHIYSNNGTWVYSSLIQKKVIPTPKLAIWDSAPFLYLRGNLDLHNEASKLSRVFISAVLRKPVYTHPILTPIVVAFLKFYIVLNKVLEKLEGNLHIVPKLHNLHKHLIEKPPSVPTVFIYSTGDQLIPPENVEEYLNILDKLGIKYHKKVFGDDCGHTSSFYVHPEEYKSFIEPYLAKVAQGNSRIIN